MTPALPKDPSGVRLGTPALTTRGMAEAQMASAADQQVVLHKMCAQVAELCAASPAPSAAP